MIIKRNFSNKIFQLTNELVVFNNNFYPSKNFSKMSIKSLKTLLQNKVNVQIMEILTIICLSACNHQSSLKFSILYKINAKYFIEICSLATNKKLFTLYKV